MFMWPEGSTIQHSCFRSGPVEWAIVFVPVKCMTFPLMVTSCPDVTWLSSDIDMIVAPWLYWKPRFVSAGRGSTSVYFEICTSFLLNVVLILYFLILTGLFCCERVLKVVSFSVAKHTALVSPLHVCKSQLKYLHCPAFLMGETECTKHFIGEVGWSKKEKNYDFRFTEIVYTRFSCKLRLTGNALVSGKAQHPHFGRQITCKPTNFTLLLVCLWLHLAL